MATLGDKAVGSIVKIKVNGTAKDFIIVHQGNPDSNLYDNSCYGTWLLMKDIYKQMAWDSSNNDYKNSDIHSYLNSTFLGLFDSNIKSAIKQVKIPYQNGTGSGGSVSSEANGLSTKLFLLSGYEVGFTQDDFEYFPIDGAKLDYFLSRADSSANNKRKANYNGSATIWWLRSPGTDNNTDVTGVLSTGNYLSVSRTASHGVRPALILDSSLSVSSDGSVETNAAPTTPASINVPSSIMGGSTASISWGAASDSEGNLSGYKLERSINGGSYSQIYSGSSRSYTDSITKGWNTVQYRVKAYDSEGAESGYTTSPSRTIINNSAPIITSNKVGNLGTLTEGFTCIYSVNDADTADSVTVTLSMDSTVIQTFTAVKEQQYTYTLGGNDWLKIANGTHTFKITAADGKDTATSTATFTRNCTSLSTTLSTPFEADDRIVACTLKVAGSIPADAVCLYEVTNNANDDSPVWEDCTAKSKGEFSYIFTNKTAANGFAFNFRVSIERGASDAGGYITQISGGFE